MVQNAASTRVKKELGHIGIYSNIRTLRSYLEIRSEIYSAEKCAAFMRRNRRPADDVLGVLPIVVLSRLMYKHVRLVPITLRYLVRQRLLFP